MAHEGVGLFAMGPVALWSVGVSARVRPGVWDIVGQGR
jgi:uncharacterized protein YqfA (UPF0365 family)